VTVAGAARNLGHLKTLGEAWASRPSGNERETHHLSPAFFAAPDLLALALARLRVEPITEADCIEIAKLRAATIKLGLSLADRACLTLAARLGIPALTTDRAWAHAEVDAEVRLIR
jgi:PIN domain nuclease of toxin-antitoxin system